MSNDLVPVEEGSLSPAPLQAETVSTVLIKGDLASLKPTEKIAYYLNLCKSLGLNPLTRPFDYLILNAKLILYVRKDATDQLRKLYRISLKTVERGYDGDKTVYWVRVRATMPDGRTDEGFGAVAIVNKSEEPLSGVDLANAMMRAETKAKRRATLSICGLGMLDETELETVNGVKKPALLNGQQYAELVDLQKENPERTGKLLAAFKVESLDQLTMEQADLTIASLNGDF